MYAVVFTYSFDQDCAVYLFQTEAEAKRFLRDNYDEELRIEREENGLSPSGSISDDGWYAVITTDNDDGSDPCVIYFHIAHVYE